MIVVDCSVVIDALTGNKDAEIIGKTLSTYELHAPSLIDYECASVVRGLILGGKLSAERGIDVINDFDNLPIHKWPNGASLIARCMSLRENVSAYDAAYLVLAEALDCPFVTRDSRLVNIPGLHVNVVVL